MSLQLLKRIEAYRKEKNLPILTLCKLMDVHNVTYHRWKKAGKITGAYKKILEDFLDKNTQTNITAVDHLSNTSSLSNKFSTNNSSDIAVIGIACYYPGASNVSELWENILARRVQFRRMLDQRLPLSAYHDEDPRSTDKTYLTKAAFLEDFTFDWGKLRIPKKTVESTDIAHWLALDTALKTFEDAGFKFNEIPLQNTGVIVGNTLTGEQTRSQTLRLRWPYVQKVLNATLGHLGKTPEERGQIASEMEKIYKSAFYPVTEDSLAGGLANTIAGRICNYLNLKGGGYIVDGACSSSLLAVATAADALKMGNMDLALAGGVDISLDPFELVGFARAGALAKDQMRVYDQKANGFLPGEGCGFVLLKRLNDAIRDKNYVYATIKGWGISSDGKGGIMEPSSSGQSFAIGRAYKDLEYKVSDVDFVEGHGTGTTKGDRVELEGIATAVENTVRKADEGKRKCGVTSFKSIVGHTKAAAGVGGLIKAVLAVNQRVLPPTANCTHPNDVFKDKAKNLYPIIQGEVLAQNKKTRAGISSAGFGGINCHVTVESHDEPKETLKPKIDERALFVSKQETEVFVFTSRTLVHLKLVIEKFKTDLRNISLAEMADLAALLNKKAKNRLPIKAAIVTDTPEHLYEALVLLGNEVDSFHVEEGGVYQVKALDAATRIILSNGVKKARIGFLYPGQGSQRLNMTRTIVERYSWARDLFKLSDLPLYEKIFLATDKFLTKEEQQDFAEQLSDTKITQPAMVLSSLVWTEFLTRLGIEPQVSLGHSLGELTAFYKAGAFDKEAVIKFAQLRGALMAADSRLSGSMVSLSCSKDKAEALIKGVSGNIVIANINSPHQTVVSGGKKEIEKIKGLAQKENITAYPLNVSNAFHSSFMKEASDKIQKNKILPDTFKNNGIKVFSCVSGEVLKGAVNLKDYFSKQVISPVNFIGAIKSASKECDLLIELGAGKVLTDLVHAIDEKIVCLPLESFAGNDRDLNVVLAEIFVRNVPVKFEELYKNRLIKTFVPASRKKFIENQCERPLKIDDQILKNTFSPVLLEVKEKVESVDEVIPGGLPELEGKDKIADLLMSLTHEITGFDRESISLNLRLLDDLNLDSIKAAELIGKAARSLGIPGQVDPSQLSNNTLGQIRDRLNELLAVSKAGAVKESVGDILKRYQAKTWVRNFVPEFNPEEIKTKNVNQLKELKNIVFLSGKSEEGLIKKLEGEFKIVKAKVQRISFGDSNAKEEKSGKIDCLVAILPKESSVHGLDKSILKSKIENLHQVTALANSNRLDKNSFVVFVQFGGGATAVASTLYLERPDLKVRIIDFDENMDDNKVLQKIIDELQTYESFSLVKYDHQLARRVVYYENSNPVEYKKRNISWSAKDVVLVTGGAKGITAQCALEFARSTKAQMVLIGRSPVPNTRGSLSSPNVSVGDLEIIQTLKQFEKENLKAKYYSCDVTNEKDVAATVKEIEKKLGKITGFIHGAGLNSLKRLKQASVQEAYQEALPKVMGAVHVCNALQSHPPKLIVGITSIIGLTGMEGSGWYGLANEILNLYLQKVSRKTQVVSIAYSVWDEVGMGAKLGSVNRLAEKGIGAIPVAEGIKHFKQLIEGNPGCQQVIVAARVAGIATWKSKELKTNNLRFLEKIEYILPGVELIAQANLNVEDDSYLLDHNWKGSLLFPFVFGFEAMAQSVAYLLGIEKFDHIKARDINLQRPISVPQDSGTTIEIHALVSEQKTRNGVQEIKVEIYSQESAYQEPHFSAIFEIVAKQDSYSFPLVGRVREGVLSPKSHIDLDMQTDIYGPILFQGKMFQCIEQIHELYYDEKTKKGECLLTAAYNKSTGPFLKDQKKFNNRFLTGDPFFIDSMLQSMQIIITPYMALPLYIGEIFLSLNKIKEIRTKVAKSVVYKVDDNMYGGDTYVEENGTCSSAIRNCRLKVMQYLLDKPNANDLVNPTKRDQAIIEHKVSELAQQMGFSVPIVQCLYDTRLRRLSKKWRHKIETPLVQSVVRELLCKGNKRSRFIKVEWLKSGRPILRGKELDNIRISLSHCDDLLICIANYGEQGCDIENVVKRSEEDWLDLLGENNFYEQKALLRLGYDLDYSGTVIWSASEAFKKALNKIDVSFKPFDYFKNTILFRNIEGQFKISICSLPIELTRGEPKILSFSMNTVKEFEGVEKEAKVDNKLSRKVGYNLDKLFGVNIDYSGPQKQLVLTQRFPVTFKANQASSRRVYFTNFFDWMGTIREYSIYPVFKEFAKLAETGEWGTVTNMTELEILGGIKSNDIVEAKIWGGDLEGNKNATIPMFYEWYRITDGGQRERVAVARQKSTWVHIGKDHSVKMERMPKFLYEYFKLMSPMTKDTSLPIEFPEPYRNISLGNKLKSYGKNVEQKFKISEKIFSTTLENSNLVGNVYFSNYVKWLGAVGDRFFYALIPSYFLEINDKNEIICLECNIHYLNDSFPFEDVLVEMYLDEMYENGLDLYFEFYRIKEGKKETKLAYAKQKIVFANWANDVEPKALNVPESVRDFFKSRESILK